MEKRKDLPSSPHKYSVQHWTMLCIGIDESIAWQLRLLQTPLIAYKELLAAETKTLHQLTRCKTALLFP
jgi:hypothetical protein